MKQLITAFVLLIALTAGAQNEATDKICTEYDERVALSELADPAVPSIKTTTTLTKRAIGPVNHEVTIYFDEHETEIEGDEDDEMMFHKEAVIRKAEFHISTVSYSIDCSYYFDEGGILIKYVERSVGYSCYLKQIYFGAKGATRIKQDKISGENCESETEVDVFDHKELTKQEKGNASWYKEDAGKFREILFLLYEMMKD